jgi:hypothetical protein
MFWLIAMLLTHPEQTVAAVSQPSPKVREAYRIAVNTSADACPPARRSDQTRYNRFNAEFRELGEAMNKAYLTTEYTDRLPEHTSICFDSEHSRLIWTQAWNTLNKLRSVLKEEDVIQLTDHDR